MLVRAVLAGDVNQGAWSSWTVLEPDDLEQIAWECGRQVKTFLQEAQVRSTGLTMSVTLTTSQEPYGDTSTAPRE